MVADFLPQDALDLEGYFNARNIPSAGGDKSNYMSMVQRAMAGARHGTTYRPTPLTAHYGPHGDCMRDGHHTHGAQPSEVIFCTKGDGGVRAGSWDDTIAAHLDARARVRRVLRALERLPRWARDVLAARYELAQEHAAKVAPIDNKTSKTLGILAGVALLTDTLAHRKRHLAGDGVVHGTREVLGELAELAGNLKPNASAIDKQNAKEALEHIRREAEQLVGKAESLYAEQRMRMQEAG